MLGMVPKAAPILICCHLGPLLIPLHGEGLQLLQLLGAQISPLSLKGGGCDLGDVGLGGGGGAQEPTITATTESCNFI